MAVLHGIAGGLKRTIDWKQGVASALGAPILILPSIGYFAEITWAFAIVIWMASVIQGALQNVAYGELATMCPGAPGLPGYCQAILGKETHATNGGHTFSGFLGGLSAWGYLMGWSFVLSVFALQIGTYLHRLIPVFSGIS
jgi:amino acid transporter